MPATIGLALASAAFAIGAPLTVVNALAGVGVVGLATQVGIGIGLSVGLGLVAQALFRAPSPKPQDQQINIRSSVAPRFRMYGRGKVGGVLLHAVASGGFFDRIFAVGQGEIDGFEEHWLDDNLLTLDGSGFATAANYIFNGRSRVQILTRPGTGSQTAFSAPGWTADHQVKGVALAHVRLEQMDIERFVTMFPNGAHTQYRTVYRGAKVPAISGAGLGTPSWSDNAARVIADYLTHPDGLGLDPSWINNAAAEWVKAAAICNEDVPLKAGGTEKRYRIWGVYRYDERPADVLSRFLAACDGRLLPTPNQGIALKVGKWEEPTVTVDDDAIESFEGVGRGRDILTTANMVRAQFTSPDHDYQATDADPWIDEADVAERGEFVRDIELFPVPSHAQARRLMKLEAHRANPNWVGTLVCNLRALPVMGERFIVVKLAELGIDETFEITSDPQFLIDPATSILRGVAFDVASLSSEAYDWDAATEEGEAPSVPGAGHAVTAVRFDGANDYLARGANLTGLADGKRGSLAVWLNMQGGDSAAQSIIATPDGRFEVLRDDDNTILVIGRNEAGDIILTLRSNIDLTAAFGWRLLLASWDLDTGLGHLFLGHGDIEDTDETVLTNDVIDYTTGNFFIGARPDESAKLNAAVSEFRFNNSYLDFSNVALRGRFIDLLGEPVAPGPDGELPEDGVPLVFLSGPVSEWHENNGTGGGFTLTGELSAHGTSPSD